MHDTLVGEDQATASKFSCDHDIQLLKQVSLTRPWEVDHGNVMLACEEVAIQLGRSPSFKINKKASALKTRFETIMNKFKAGEASSKRKSGTVEEYEEREQLLTDMRSLMRDHEESSDARRDVKKRKAEGIESSGVLMRRMAIAE
ncbi:hypothetical protein As57867_017261, partial [Aphanomyces stellatus]